MNILDRLVQLANKLDAHGLHSEATMVDEIIKEAAPPNMPGGNLGQLFRKDPNVMPAGAGAGGLPQVPGPWLSSRPALPPKPGTPEWNKAKIVEINKPKNTGVAGKGRLRHPRVLKFQQQYNAVWNNLKSIGFQVANEFGPALVTDSLWGSKTARARKLMPKLKNTLQHELARAQKGVAGKGPQQGFNFEQQGYSPTPAQPVQRRQQRGGESFAAAQEQTGSIWRDLVMRGKDSGRSSARITQYIEHYIGRGMSPAAAGQKARQRLGI